MRRERDAARSELARSKAEVERLEERCRVLEKTLLETREIVKARDAEIERLKRGSANGARLSGESRRSGDGRSSAGSVRSPSRLSTNDALGVVGKRSSASSMLSRRPMSPPSHRPMSPPSHRPMSPAIRRPPSPSSSASSTDSAEERAQIQSLEPFLTKTDRWSGAQVIQAVQDLNSEILQFAAAATETCVFAPRAQAQIPPARAAQARQDCVLRLGEPMARLLAARDHSQDPILVQLALQGCIATCIARAMTLFCMGFQSKPNHMLSQIYAQMATLEPQPTSSRWRALTHRHLHTLHPELAEHAVTDLTQTLLRWCADVLLLASCAPPDAPFPAPPDALRARFGAQVRRIARGAAALKAVVSEEIMSTAFEVVGAPGGDAFDARVMADAFEEYAPSRGAVLCTSELGIQCATRTAAEGVVGGGGEGVIARRLLAPPKVVLESVVDVLT